MKFFASTRIWLHACDERFLGRGCAVLYQVPDLYVAEISLFGKEREEGEKSSSDRIEQNHFAFPEGTEIQSRADFSLY
jgi:hypothetical protein